ncbi:5-formyltetrahydrofolate cyclo-ligase [Aquamicrobium sp.]|uniref:5-formyltetrahydrofolate cyclo-ligase n=1 Tax=Aquamicrobium sp. TaxID=1872579 RepID=UPI00258ECD87|nr:5-formyltetrahydrofolate cyclo-ligase [Aquamicrobium sp.]MCK9550185.1 5-formyltetrahydrofolate cyclo-ligase [Aquamicrobium sp.]
MISLKEQKNSVRREALARRDALDQTWRIEMSLRIAELGAPGIDIEPGTVVAGFLPIRSEIDLRPLMTALREKGARICVPVVLDKQTIVFRELDRRAELIDSGFGTVGPGPDAAVLDPSVMLMPLAAFDQRGHRLGYGAGYYDRAIARMHERGLKPRLIGTAFECQKVERVPEENHDVALDEILTELGLRHFRKADNPDLAPA